MSLRWMRSSDAPAVRRGHVVVCLVEEDGPADPADSEAILSSLEPDGVALAVGLAELGQLPGVSGGADLVLVSPAARPPAGWLARLRAPADADATVGTVTALGDELLDAFAARHDDPSPDSGVQGAGAHLRPRSTVARPDCLYLPRRSLELIEGLPTGSSTLAAVAAEVCARCLARGLLNVIAGDLYVSRRPSSVPAQRPPGAVAPGAAAPGAVAPGAVAPVADAQERSPLGRTVRIAEAAIDGLSLTIDARALGPSVGGTQRYTLDLLLALARFTELRLRAVIASDIDPAAAEALRATARVQLITYEQAIAGVERSQVVHRPQQVFSNGDLTLLSLLGRRMVVTHQDLIAYHNPDYHATTDAWAQHRRITQQALAVADRVVFFSAHSREDAIAEDLVAVARTQIIGAAVFAPEPSAAQRPDGVPADYILCLGSDYRHKNRPFAISLVRWLRAEHGWPGGLVLAGPHVSHGSTRADEDRRLDEDPDLRASVWDLGSVSDAHREWLIAHARAVAVPSVVEGFGLVPLEAAQAGVPCLFAPQPPLTEVVDGSLATLIAWEPRLSAAAVAPLLGDGPARDRHLERLTASAQRWSWEQIARSLVECYAETMRSPYRLATEHTLNVVRREHHYQEIERRHTELMEEIEDRLALVRDDGFLSAAEQRGLLRIGSRPGLARALLWPFALVGAVRGRQR